MKPIRILALMEAASITGPAKNMLQFIRRLRSHYPQSPVEMSLATFRRPGMSPLIAETAKRENIPHYVIEERGRWDMAVLPQLRRIVEKVHPDIVQSHAVKSHFLVALAGLHRERPWVAVHHGYTWPDVRMRLYNQLDRWSLRKAHRVLTVSEAFRMEFIRKGISSDRIHVFHNTIDSHWAAAERNPARVSALREGLGLSPSTRVILIVGRLSKEKDHLTLLRALARIYRKENREAWHLLIVGDGPDRERLITATQSLGLGKAVSFIGQVESSAPYYGIADLCVLSSRSEGSPNALLEAMAARVPVVATAVGGVAEIVTDEESALLVEPGDPVALASAIDLLLKHRDYAARLADEAYRRVLSHHAPETYMRRLIQFYQTAANPGAEKILLS